MNSKIFPSLVLLLFSIISSFSQSFVNPVNSWYLDDCITVTGEIRCTTFRYWFGDDIVPIDGKEYRELFTTNADPILEVGRYYRESDKKVFMKYESEEEILIYDFNLDLAEEFELVVEPGISQILTVLEIDQVTLENGEQRKGWTLENEFGDRTQWLEGIGGVSSTMNPALAFSYDAWVEFNCYRINDIVQYSEGDCVVTSAKEKAKTETEFILFPNPAFDKIILRSAELKSASFVSILDLSGRVLKKKMNLSAISLRDLSKGMYFLNVHFDNGQVKSLRFVKA